MEGFFGQPFHSVCAPLLRSIRPDGGVPFFVEGKEKIRTTVIATCLVTLADMGLIERETTVRLQTKLLELKDSMDADDEKRGDRGVAKMAEDVSAWCVGETASVWSTSFALWGLLRTGYVGAGMASVISGLEWLIDQQNPSNAWGYQRYRNCRDNTMMTALAMLALCEARKRSSEIGTEVGLGRKIETAIDRGMRYLLGNVNEDKKSASWPLYAGENAPHAPSTVWALLLFKKLHSPDLFRLLPKGLSYLASNVRSDGVWEMRKFVDETGTKYGIHKSYFYFTPSLLPPLLDLGVSPYDQLCLGIMRWLREHREACGWLIRGYDVSAPQTFTTAMALHAVYSWYRRAALEVWRSLDNRVSAPSSVVRVPKLEKRVAKVTALLLLTWTVVAGGAIWAAWAVLSPYLGKIARYTGGVFLPSVLASVTVAIVLGLSRRKLASLARRAWSWLVFREDGRA